VSSTIPSSNNITAKGVIYPEVTSTDHQNQSTSVSTINPNSSAITISSTNPSSMLPVPNVISMLLVENQRRRLLEQKQQKPISLGDVTILDVPLEEVELPPLFVGMLVDLCEIQQELQDNGNGNEELYYYKPLDANKMPMMSKPTQIESGRVDVRISNLMQELQKLT
jgi:hypothetical protein